MNNFTKMRSDTYFEKQDPELVSHVILLLNHTRYNIVSAICPWLFQIHILHWQAETSALECACTNTWTKLQIIAYQTLQSCSNDSYRIFNQIFHPMPVCVDQASSGLHHTTQLILLIMLSRLEQKDEKMVRNKAHGHTLILLRPLWRTDCSLSVQKQQLTSFELQHDCKFWDMVKGPIKYKKLNKLATAGMHSMLVWSVKNNELATAESIWSSFGGTDHYSLQTEALSTIEM